MVIIASDCIVNMEQVQLTHVEDGVLVFDVADGAIRLANCPDNALQQLAIATSQGKEFLEMEDAVLVMEDEDEGGTNDN